MKFLKKFKRLSLPAVGFFQAVGLSLYCGLVGTIFWQGENWFGKMDSYLGPFLVLCLLVVSVLICGLIAFGYPVYLFWEKKKTKKSLRLVVCTCGWLLFLIILFILFFANY